MPEQIAVILADGRSSNKHIQNPYALKVRGQTLIVRTVRQFSQRMPTIVATRREDVRRLVQAQKNISYYPPSPYQDYGGVAMMMKGLERAWAIDTLVVFGDVYYTDDAVETMVAPVEDWAAYGRKTDNPWTGTPWGEFFGFRTNWRVRGEMSRAARTVRDKFFNKQIRRASPWEWYFEMEEMPYTIKDPRNVEVGPHWVDINDVTDDIDYEGDVDGIERALARR